MTVSLVAKHLKIGKSSASRRVNTALENGWLLNKSEKTNGKSYDLHVGEPMPGDEVGLPDPSLLTDRSTVPPDLGGDIGGTFKDRELVHIASQKNGEQWTNGEARDETDDEYWNRIQAERAVRRETDN